MKLQLKTNFSNAKVSSEQSQNVTKMLKKYYQRFYIISCSTQIYLWVMEKMWNKSVSIFKHFQHVKKNENQKSEFLLSNFQNQNCYFIQPKSNKISFSLTSFFFVDFYFYLGQSNSIKLFFYHQIKEKK